MSNKADGLRMNSELMQEAQILSSFKGFKVSKLIKRASEIQSSKGPEKFRINTEYTQSS